MDSVEDSINKFLDKYIFTQGIESRVGQYGNDVVDLINKFIRIIIAFMIVYLIITKIPKSKDADHTMYFNLIILISLLLLLMYIQKNWRKYYINKFLGAADIGPKCAGDLDDVQKTDDSGNPCPQGFEDNASILIDAVIVSLTDEFKDWKNYLYLIIIGIGLRQLDYPMYYAAAIFFPFNCFKGIIYYLFFASKYSPINFLFGKTGNEVNPYIYGNKISEGKLKDEETELKNFNDKFFLMYIVLILLIFLAIIRRLTSNTIIDCQHFKDPFFIKYLDGCIGYRFYMILNVILFIGFSTDFMDSLDKISLDNQSLICPWKVDITGNQSPLSEQMYTAREGECLAPEKIIDTPICNITNEIIECKPNKDSTLEGCLINRSDYNRYNYRLRDVAKFNEEKNDGRGYRIVIKKNPDGDGYIIDPDLNKIDISNSTCKNSIENWLSKQTDDGIFQTFPESILDTYTNFQQEEINLLLGTVEKANDTKNDVLTNVRNRASQGLNFVASGIENVADGINNQ